MDQIDEMSELKEIEDMRGLLLEIARTQRAILSRLEQLTAEVEKKTGLTAPDKQG